ncbi:chloramphenicol phosphotransferase CPT family protein [Sphingorhabdus sp. Alg231-15]|uniref:chloramphenicol phosphotransferase CPT family protein n=1 Tax=Sphingorhabdus sp. Alg231-15 TaxID=1922222 RepID=UPI00307C892B
MEGTGKVIVLNGASSSGKSTLARALQFELTDTYLHCQLDAFWNMTPPTIPASSANFPRMKLAMAKSVKALAETGHNVIVDIIYSGLKSHLEFSSTLDGIGVLVIKLDCKLDELERRELERGDRKLGLAKSQLDVVHEEIPYDLELDTSISSPAECVEEIVARINLLGL